METVVTDVITEGRNHRKGGASAWTQGRTCALIIPSLMLFHL